MTITFLAKNSTACPPGLVAFMSRLAALADRPRSPTGTTPEDRADRQRAVAFASPERSELGINDEVAAPHPPGPTYQHSTWTHSAGADQYSKRTKMKAIAIIRRSCSDSLLTARQMD